MNELLHGVGLPPTQLRAADACTSCAFVHVHKGQREREVHVHKGQRERERERELDSCVYPMFYMRTTATQGGN